MTDNLSLLVEHQYARCTLIARGLSDENHEKVKAFLSQNNGLVDLGVYHYQNSTAVYRCGEPSDEGRDCGIALTTSGKRPLIEDASSFLQKFPMFKPFQVTPDPLYHPQQALELRIATPHQT